MATEGLTTRSTTGRRKVTVRKKETSTGSTLKFGSVTISGSRPTAAAVRKNVERSTAALERVTKRLTRPGVALPQKRDVPHFSVADGEPGIFIRRLNGVVQRGRLVDGAFKAID